MRLVADDCSSQHVAMASEIFCRAVHDNICAEIEGAEKHRSREGMVDDQHSASLMSKLRDFLHSSDTHKRIRYAFHEDASRLRLMNRPCHGLQIADIDIAHLDAEGTQ